MCTFHALRCAAVLSAAVMSLSAAATQAETIYGITDIAVPQLFSFDSATPGAPSVPIAITGLVAGQTMRAIDFRPADGLLYGMATASSTSAQLYTINTTTAVATPLGAVMTLTGNTSVGLSMDWNPVTDELRVVSIADWNGRVSPAGALILRDTNLTAATTMVGIAYDNNNAGASSTTLYGYDWITDNIVTIAGNSGVTAVVGNSGFVSDLQLGGFDVSPSGNAWLSITNQANPNDEFRSVTLGTGNAPLVGSFPTGFFVRDISTPPTGAGVPEPATMGLLAVGAVGLIRRSRRRA